MRTFHAFAALIALVTLSGCDKVSQVVMIAARQAMGSADMAKKGYATEDGRIVRVAEPDGPPLQSGETFLPGTYVLQGYDETGRPAFTDGWRIGEHEGATRVFDKMPLQMLQGRMKIDHGSPGYQASDYPCSMGAIVHEDGGRYSATGSCRIVSQGVTQEFEYSGQARQNGFVIDVVRTVSGADPTVPAKSQFHIVAHLQSDEAAS